MVVPALIYALINAGGAGAGGWGIPMATDIAFALGVLALVGPTVPISLKIFLAALAIVDDLGAVLVIAIFYSSDISWNALGAALAVLGVLVLVNRMRVRRPLVYGALGVLLWLFFLQSGVHATVAGVLLAATIPVRTRLDSTTFLTRGRILLEEFEFMATSEQSLESNPHQQRALRALEKTCEQAQSPLHRIESVLHGWVAFGIMPLFALANAGVRLEGISPGVLLAPPTLGVTAGLLIGKPLGITLFAWLASKLGVAARPPGVDWATLHRVSWLGGVGFTMSLFIATLAFGQGELMDQARIGILIASFLAGGIAWIMLRRAR
jgi:NhaA family Na+:H+ antiporter